jgi:hypothetical protein
MRHVAEVPDIGFAALVGLPPGLEVITLADLLSARGRRRGDIRGARPFRAHVLSYYMRTIDYKYGLSCREAPTARQDRQGHPQGRQNAPKGTPP